MLTVWIVEDILDRDSWEQVTTNNLAGTLMERWEKFPSTGRIYRGQVASTNDITPSSVNMHSLDNLDNEVIYVVIYPAGPAIILAAVAILAIGVIIYLLTSAEHKARPYLPGAKGSPNNQLGNLKNTVRLGERIADMYGELLCIPDLLSVPYSQFESNREVEVTYLCLGRGYFDITADNVKLSNTAVGDIAGCSVEIYEPGTSPNSSGSPQLTIGEPITDTLQVVRRYGGVNGQRLLAYGQGTVVGNLNISFVYPDTIVVEGNETDFENNFKVGDELVVTNADYEGDIEGTGGPISETIVCSYSGSSITITGGDLTPYTIGSVIIAGSSFATGLPWQPTASVDGVYTIVSINTGTNTLILDVHDTDDEWAIIGLMAGGVTPAFTATLTTTYDKVDVDLSGTYTIRSLDSTSIVLSSPGVINSDWTVLATLVGEATGGLSATLHTDDVAFEGTFEVLPESDAVWFNFIAPSGLYKVDTEQIGITVDLLVKVDTIEAGSIVATSQQQVRLKGSPSSRKQIAVTHRYSLDPTKTYQVSVVRLTPRDTSSPTVVDDVLWRDLYCMKSVTDNDFGDVTTVLLRTSLASGAVADSTELNITCTRKIPIRSGTSMTTTRYASKSAADILVAVTVDATIGNKTLTAVDLDSVYDAYDACVAYFGTALAAEFSYTFDDANTSYEEIVSLVATAMFSRAYRQGMALKLSFEKATEDSVLLFNHRNKLPGTDTTSYAFGTTEDVDGVAYEWTDPNDLDNRKTIYLPNASISRPKKVASTGVRNGLQAYLQAQRIYARILSQNTSVSFTATQEAAMLVIGDRILVADNSRADTQDGEVLSQNGLELTLSQEVTFVFGDYYIFLQGRDGTVESIECVAGSASNKVILAHAPTESLVLGDDRFVRTLYQVVGGLSSQARPFIVAEKDYDTAYTHSIKAVAYSDLFYAHDKDYIDEVVDENGELI